MSAIDQLRTAIVDGIAKEAVSQTELGLAEGVAAVDLLQDGLMAAMREVGQLFEDKEIYVPEMLVSAYAMKASLAILRPHLVDSDVQASGRVAIGTVEGDLHDIGKNLVAMMLQGSGFEVEDLGVDVYPERFVQAARDGAEASLRLLESLPRPEEQAAAKLAIEQAATENVITSRNAEPGEVLGAGQAAITVADVSRPFVRRADHAESL